LRETAVDWVNRIVMISGSSDPAQYLSAKIAISAHALWKYG